MLILAYTLPKTSRRSTCLPIFNHDGYFTFSYDAMAQGTSVYRPIRKSILSGSLGVGHRSFSTF